MKDINPVRITLSQYPPPLLYKWGIDFTLSIGYHVPCLFWNGAFDFESGVVCFVLVLCVLLSEAG